MSAKRMVFLNWIYVPSRWRPLCQVCTAHWLRLVFEGICSILFKAGGAWKSHRTTFVTKRDSFSMVCRLPCGRAFGVFYSLSRSILLLWKNDCRAFLSCLFLIVPVVLVVGVVIDGVVCFSVLVVVVHCARDSAATPFIAVVVVCFCRFFYFLFYLT